LISRTAVKIGTGASSAQFDIVQMNLSILEEVWSRIDKYRAVLLKTAVQLGLPVAAYMA